MAAQFAKVKEGRRGNSGYEDALLAFYAALDPEADAYYVKAIDSDVNTIREAALRRANQLLEPRRHAVAPVPQQWADRGRAAAGGRHLAEVPRAGPSAGRGAGRRAPGPAHLHQLKAGDLAEWTEVRDEIQAEVDLQRRSLNDLRMVLDPAVLQAKLELVGEGSKEAAPASAPASTTASGGAR